MRVQRARVGDRLRAVRREVLSLAHPGAQRNQGLGARKGLATITRAVREGAGGVRARPRRGPRRGGRVGPRSWSPRASTRRRGRHERLGARSPRRASRPWRGWREPLDASLVSSWTPPWTACSAPRTALPNADADEALNAGVWAYHHSPRWRWRQLASDMSPADTHRILYAALACDWPRRDTGSDIKRVAVARLPRGEPIFFARRRPRVAPRFKDLYGATTRDPSRVPRPRPRLRVARRASPPPPEPRAARAGPCPLSRGSRCRAPVLGPPRAAPLSSPRHRRRCVDVVVPGFFITGKKKPCFSSASKRERAPCACFGSSPRFCAWTWPVDTSYRRRSAVSAPPRASPPPPGSPRSPSRTRRRRPPWRRRPLARTPRSGRWTPASPPWTPRRRSSRARTRETPWRGSSLVGAASAPQPPPRWRSAPPPPPPGPPPPSFGFPRKRSRRTAVLALEVIEALARHCGVDLGGGADLEPAACGTGLFEPRVRERGVAEPAPVPPRRDPPRRRAVPVAVGARRRLCVLVLGTRPDPSPRWRAS